MDQLQEIAKKMSKIEDSLSKIQIQLATQGESDANHKVSCQRLMVRSDENQTKIVALEVQIAKINTKIMIFGVVATILVPLVTGFLMKILFHDH